MLEDKIKECKKALVLPALFTPLVLGVTGAWLGYNLGTVALEYVANHITPLFISADAIAQSGGISEYTRMLYKVGCSFIGGSGGWFSGFPIGLALIDWLDPNRKKSREQFIKDHPEEYRRGVNRMRIFTEDE